MTAKDRAFLYEWRPYQFALQPLGLEEDEVLRAFMTSEADELLWLAARQTGKTTAFAAKATHFALFNPQSLTVIVSATQRQAGILQRRVTTFLRRLHRREKWRTVRAVDVPSDPLNSASQLVRCSIQSLELANGSEVVSVPASADTVRGYAPNLIIVDEAARVPDPVYGAIRPMRAVTHARLIAGSSAAGQRGWFHQEWTEGDPGWERLEVLAADCPRISADFLERERRKHPAHIFEAEYENVFYAPAGRLFTPEMIANMFSSEVEMIDVDFSPSLVSEEVW